MMGKDAWRNNPDEVIARFRKRHDKTPLVVSADPIIWDVVGGPPQGDHATLLIRPWEGELLLSLSTVASAPQALLRRPWLQDEEPEGE